MRLNIQELSAEDVATEYAQKFDARIDERRTDETLNAEWRNVHNAITEVLSTTRGNRRNGWFDEDCSLRLRARVRYKGTPAPVMWGRKPTDRWKNGGC